jgi:hypothetical protein
MCEKALHLIETTPWLMKTIATWDVDQVSSLYTTAASLVVEENDPVNLVDGYETPPTDALISLVASKAGATLSIIKNATKSALASVPVLGSKLGIAKHCDELQGQVDSIRIKGTAPSSRADFQLVLRALQREKAIYSFHHEMLEPRISREGWPIDAFYDTSMERRRLRQNIVDILAHASRTKELAQKLKVADEIERAVEVRTLDHRRTMIAARIQLLAEDVVDARVVSELSRHFSADAESALVRFAQLAGRNKFGTAQAAKMSQRQRRRRQEYLDAFEKCVRYIPCWVLTSSQISDYLPPECLFDLVVIDEASQSDVTVLPGMLRGKQWLIVGDGKQVSPTESFVSEEQIESLKAALPKSPLEDSLLPGHSFFDLCAQAFPKGRVCVPLAIPTCFRVMHRVSYFFFVLY